MDRAKEFQVDDQGQWGLRIDLHPINGGSTPIIHINYGPAARDEAAHLVLFDPRWVRK